MNFETKSIDIKIPTPVSYVLNVLFNNNHKAYVVGGCVRDSILRKSPKDWDVCTSATPEEVIAMFRSKDYAVIETGLKHGTVTAMVGDMPIEITTFRVDGEYSNGRCPDDVKFVSDLKEDLSRRDFTINAMAYNYAEGLIDLFDGVSDLGQGIIRCVGNANERFQEDGLRMLRAIRFSARFGFKIEDNTYTAIQYNNELINKCSAERIRDELSQIIICSPSGLKQMFVTGLLQHILPELVKTMPCKQNNEYHKYTVGNHILKTMECIDNDLALRLTMMLHDIAKPPCKTKDIHGVDHFYGHNQMGADMAVEILGRLRYENLIIMKVRDLILYHDAEIHDNIKSVRRWLNRIGEERFRELIKVKVADIFGQNEDFFFERMNKFLEIGVLIDEVIEKNQCFSKRDLAINGRDLMDAGYPQGKMIGFIIDALVDKVIENPEYNTKEKLLEIVPTIRGFRRLTGVIEEGMK